MSCQKIIHCVLTIQLFKYEMHISNIKQKKCITETAILHILYIFCDAKNFEKHQLTALII